MALQKNVKRFQLPKRQLKDKANATILSCGSFGAPKHGQNATQ